MPIRLRRPAVPVARAGKSRPLLLLSQPGQEHRPRVVPAKGLVSGQVDAGRLQRLGPAALVRPRMPMNLGRATWGHRGRLQALVRPVLMPRSAWGEGNDPVRNRLSWNVRQALAAYLRTAAANPKGERPIHLRLLACCWERRQCQADPAGAIYHAEDVVGRWAAWGRCAETSRGSNLPMVQTGKGHRPSPRPCHDVVRPAASLSPLHRGDGTGAGRDAGGCPRGPVLHFTPQRIAPGCRDGRAARDRAKDPAHGQAVPRCPAEGQG